ncbi:MAG: prepilin-type N-terminal cleavage/methylation domain-containing protein [Candidatus Competibacteraceae bacterium]
MGIRQLLTAGFTLLEMLVTLVIVSLLMALLMQTLLYALQLRTRILEQQWQQQAVVLQEYWFRSSSAALAPGKKDRPEVVFAGDRTGFQGLSLAPLLGDLGVPIRIEWRLETDAKGVTLRYRQGEDSPGWIIAQWEGAQAGFGYRDEAGQWGERWPPSALAVSATEPGLPQLPTAIRLDITRTEAPVLWLSAITGRRDPKVDVQEWLLTPNLPSEL